MFRLIHATLVHPSLCLPHSNPTVTVTVTIAPVSLLLLLCCCYYKLLLLINFYEQELFPGAAELTTQLLRLASIIWLPLCQINKLGNTTREDCCDPLHLWVINALARTVEKSTLFSVFTHVSRRIILGSPLLPMSI